MFGWLAMRISPFPVMNIVGSNETISTPGIRTPELTMLLTSSVFENCGLLDRIQSRSSPHGQGGRRAQGAANCVETVCGIAATPTTWRSLK
jgi:hypothetical protein